jgi:hypothetical protein
LQDHGRALWRRLTEVRTGDVEILADVVDFPYARGLRVYATLLVEDDGIGPPG